MKRKLTSAEHAVLVDISLGYRNRESAVWFRRSEETIKSHARSVYAKLGARNRAQAVAIGFREGYLSKLDTRWPTY